jgi:uncharacterized membrane protein
VKSGRVSRGDWAWLALLGLSWAVILAVDPWADDTTTDFYLYRPWADAMLDGLFPYRDFQFEYPPLAAPVIALAGAGGTGHDEYRLGLALLTFALTAGLLFACARLAVLTGGDRRFALAGVALSPLLAGAMIRTHFDVAAVAIAVAALAAIGGRRVALGFALLGVGAMTKVFPLAIAPVAFAWLWGRGERADAWRGVAALAVTLVVLGAGWLLISPSGAVDSVRYQAERPVQIESNAAMVLLTLNAAGAEAPKFVDSHRAQAVEHDLEGTLGLLSSALGVAALALLALLAARRPALRDLALASLGAVVALLVFGKVLSPQFTVWLIPLMALALAHRMWPLAAVSAAALVLTLVEFPTRYDDYLRKEAFTVVVVGLRNLLLVVCLALVVRELGSKWAARRW